MEVAMPSWTFCSIARPERHDARLRLVRLLLDVDA
jgi:hypothetical protein